MLGIFAAMVTMAAGYPPTARFLPLVVGIPALGLTLVQLGIELARARRGHATRAVPPAEDGARLRREAALFLWFGLLLGGVVLVGFAVAVPLFVAAFLRLREGESRTVAAGAAAAALAVLLGVFEYGLDLPLYRGLIGPF